MHPPHIIINADDEDKEFAESFVARGKQHLYTTRNFANKANLRVYQRREPITGVNDAFITTSIHGEIQRIIITLPRRKTPKIEEEVVKKEVIKEEFKFGLYSGLTYENKIEMIDPDPEDEDETLLPHLVSFNPTTECREDYPDDFEPGVAFQPNLKLGVPAHPDVGDEIYRYEDESQHRTVRGCQYSGPIAEIAAVLLGLESGTLSGGERALLLEPSAHQTWVDYVTETGFSIQYDFQWHRCHQVYKDSKGQWWILEFSITNGIIARHLPMLVGAGLNIANEEERPESVAFVNKFKGIPSGESFPIERQDILDGIEDEWIMELMSPEDYGTAIMDEEEPYSYGNNWTFTEDSREARVTSKHYIIYPPEDPQRSNNSWLVNSYWKLNLSETTGPGNEVILQATIELIDSEICAAASRGDSPGTGRMEVWFYDFSYDGHDNIRLPYHEDSWESTVPASVDQVVWVGRCNGEWEEIFYQALKYERQSTGVGSGIEAGPEGGPNSYDTLLQGGRKWLPYEDIEDLYSYNVGHCTSTSYDFDKKEVFDGAYGAFNQVWASPNGGPIVEMKYYVPWPGPPPTLVGKSHVYLFKFQSWNWDYTVNNVASRPSPPVVYVSYFVCAYNRNAYMVRSQWQEYEWSASKIDHSVVHIPYKYKYGIRRAWCPDNNAYLCPEVPDPVYPPLPGEGTSYSGFKPDPESPEFVPENKPGSSAHLFSSGDMPIGDPWVETFNPEWNFTCDQEYVPEGDCYTFTPLGDYKDGIWDIYTRPGGDASAAAPGWGDHWQDLAGEYADGSGMEGDVGYSTFLSDAIYPLYRTHRIYDSPDPTVDPPIDDHPYNDLSIKPKYELYYHAVGHKVPGGIQMVSEYFPPNGWPPNYGEPGYFSSGPTVNIQTPILGKDAMIYSDMIYTESGRYKMLSDGTMPSLPDDNTYKFTSCTFVGVNGSSSP